MGNVYRVNKNGVELTQSIIPLKDTAEHSPLKEVKAGGGAYINLDYDSINFSDGKEDDTKKG
ncbi:hypothetical protein EDC18_10697 [Natranaerovirga pectinivora]|uniref:Uncharacterized protein n=1 Tax=Natranaerovirga pectinivora TaxID=682400 RepID=A0A4R3MJK1_9FIRM|nr:hypothetical protein [Natranaerovirga pectinivora]TCT14300.1 hypothetical protein EDC18_10697 [Natranaerovirga pectinivora]